ncbi:amino acid ABC transporter permease [Burkholderia cepacia]|uniref:amino acid ABC transporter permease n=1 Tax=Burkholderia cepacia TaxID=292 RepID=UPI00158A8B2D|nr:ABC transporter permease subunit [Burkholderia cepacia]
MSFDFLFQQVASGEHATYLDWVFRGVFYTVITSAVSFAMAMVLGMAMGVARSRLGRFGAVSNGVFELVSAIPLMVMVFITFQIVPMVFFPDLAKHMDFMILTLSMGILGLSIFTGMRVSNHIYASINAISDTQKSACKVLGFSDFQSYRLVILPQALKNSIPSLTGEFTSVVKNSSALSAIGLPEITKQIQNVIDNTSSINEPFIIAFCVYVAICSVIIGSAKLLENHLGRTA